MGEKTMCFECELDLAVCAFGKEYCDHYTRLRKERTTDRLIVAIDRLSSVMEKRLTQV